MKVQIRYLIYGLAAGALLLYILKPGEQLPHEFAIGTVVIPPEYWQKQLEDVSERNGVERVSRKDAPPTSSAVAPQAAAPLVDRFVAAATDTVWLPADSSRPAPRDTVCLGAGGSYRLKGTLLRRTGELTLLPACSNGDGRILRYAGLQPDWSYQDGTPRVSVSRLPQLADWMTITGIAAGAYGLGAGDWRFVGGGAGLVLITEIIF